MRLQRPFRHVNSREWVNLAVAAVLVFYVAQIALDLVWGTVCGHIAADYCATWATARIANTLGYSRIYDVQLIATIERSLFPTGADPALFVATPSPYLAIFVPLFQPFALLPPAAGYILWTLLNVSALLLYLRFLGSKLAGRPPSTRFLVLIMASLPVFFTVFYGNAAVWLMICVGEFLRAMVSGHEIRAGLWLGGLMLKPPLLVLLGLVLLAQRAYRVLASLSASSGAMIGATYLIVGPAGFAQMLAIWGRSTVGQPSDGVESMMNWRMLAANLSPFTSSWAAWGLAAVGMVLTLAIALRVWRRQPDPASDAFPVAYSGIFAATTVVAWHSHVHTAVVLIPALMVLHERKILPQWLLYAWCVAPALLFIAILLPENLIRLNLLPNSAMHLVFLMRGGGELGVSLLVFLWAARRATLGP